MQGGWKSHNQNILVVCSLSSQNVHVHHSTQGFQSAESIHAINLLTSGLFTVNTMWTNWNVLSKIKTIKVSLKSCNVMFTFPFVLRWSNHDIICPLVVIVMWFACVLQQLCLIVWVDFIKTLHSVMHIHIMYNYSDYHKYGSIYNTIACAKRYGWKHVDNYEVRMFYLFFTT